jgi:hypothetical protein
MSATAEAYEVTRSQCRAGDISVNEEGDVIATVTKVDDKIRATSPGGFNLMWTHAPEHNHRSRLLLTEAITQSLRYEGLDVGRYLFLMREVA